MTRKYLIIGICIFLIVLFAPFLRIGVRIGYAVIHGTFLQIMGYPVDRAPWELAEEIVNTGKDVSYCMTLQQSIPTMGPTIESRRTACVFEYAKITQDASACKLLLPSEYGMACLSEVGGMLFAGAPCSGTYGRDEVLCRMDEGGQLKIEHPQLENCSSYTNNDLRNWCYGERTRTKKQVYECNKVTNTSLFDECEDGYAFKQKDPTLCSQVKDEKRRAYCEIRINTWLQYPELRDSFYFGTPVPVDTDI